MEAGGITFMPGKTILGVFLIVFIHDPVAGYLCDNRCRRYGKAFGITGYYGFGRAFRGKLNYTIYQDIIRSHRQIIQSYHHGLPCSLEYVDLIDTMVVYDTDAYDTIFEYLRVGDIPFPRGKFF